MSKGWFNESYKHKLAEQGIKSAKKVILATPQEFIKHTEKEIIPLAGAYLVGGKLTAKGKSVWKQYQHLYNQQNLFLETTPIRDVGASGIRIMGYGTEASMDIFRELTKANPHFIYTNEKIRKIKIAINDAKEDGWGDVKGRDKIDFLKQLYSLQNKVKKEVILEPQKKLMLDSLELTEHMVNKNTSRTESTLKKIEKNLNSHKNSSGVISFDIHKLPEKEYEKMSSEKKLLAHGNMSYASCETNKGIDGDHDIFVRDTKNKKVLNKLIAHEKAELPLYNKLIKAGYSSQIASQKAHELNPVKIANKDVDKAFGNIGDPV